MRRNRDADDFCPRLYHNVVAKFGPKNQGLHPDERVVADPDRTMDLSLVSKRHTFTDIN